MRTKVEVVLGKTAYLPCQCGKWSVGTQISPRWKNNRGEDLVLEGSEVARVPLEERKYYLYNDLTRLKVRNDCSLVLSEVTWEDQGEYLCTFLDPYFKYVSSRNRWMEGHVVRKVTLVIKDLSLVKAVTMAEEVREQLNYSIYYKYSNYLSYNRGNQHTKGVHYKSPGNN